MTDLIPAAQYIRYSSEMQRDGHTVASQADTIARYAAEHGMAVIETFKDEAISGGTHERKQFQRLLLMARSGRQRWQAILVYDYNRFSRAAADISILEELDRLGVPVISVTQQHDRSAGGRLVRNLGIVIGAHERERLSEDIARRKKSKAITRRKSNATRPPFGYKREAGEDVPDEPRFTIWREMVDRMLTGTYSAGDIAKELRARGILTRDNRAFSKDTVLGMLRNPFYAGKIVYRGMAGKGPDGKPKRRSKNETLLFDGTHQPLMSWAEHERLQVAMRTHGRSRPGRAALPHHQYLLQDLAVCAGCDKRMTCGMAGGSGHESPYYICRSHERGIPCPAKRHYLAESVLVAQVDEFIASLKLTEDVIDEAIELSQSVSVQDERAQMAANLRGEMKRLGTMFQAGGMAEADYLRELARIKRDMADLEAQPAPSIAQAAESLIDFAGQWAEMSTKERNNALLTILAGVVVDIDERAIVEWRVKAAYKELVQAAR
jgi:site-specific DNA recombinase